MKTFNLDTPLIRLSDLEMPGIFFTIGNAVEGTQTFGGIGSGKTSGSGCYFARKYLKADFGGLVLCVKPDEKILWQEYCADAGRSDDLIIVGPNEKNYFNFLAYESDKGQTTDNIVDVLKTVIRASQEQSRGTSDDSFWETALDMLIGHVVDLCKLAEGKVTVQMMYDVVQTMPKEGVFEFNPQKAFFKMFVSARERVLAEKDEWQVKNPDLDCLDWLSNARTLKFLDDYFFETYRTLPEKTRSIIDFSFSGFLFQLLRDPVYSLFCHHESTFTPDDCRNGKIILLDLPIKVYHKTGRDCQILFKYIWQRAMELKISDDYTRPVFLWADEAQHFLHEQDTAYQATTRSSRVATVYITQNLPNYFVNMGGTKYEFNVKSFLGTLGTKIFHANVDVDTNKYAAELIGDTNYQNISTGTNHSDPASLNINKSLLIDKAIRPEHFARLKTGRARNNYQIEAYIHIQGDLLGGDKNHLKVNFYQTPIF